MTEPHETPSTPVESNQPVTPGELLRTARLGLSLSEDDVAGELYMTAYRVRLIENNEFKKLNADAFVRGYLKAYAVLVKLDPDVVLAAFKQLDSGASATGFVATRKAPSQNRKILALLGVVAAVLGFLWLISIWFLDNPRGQVHQAPPTAAPVAQVPSAVVADPADAVAVDADEDDLAVNTLAQENPALLPQLSTPASTLSAQSTGFSDVSESAQTVSSAQALSSTQVSSLSASTASSIAALVPVVNDALASSSQITSAAVSLRAPATVGAIAGLDQLRLVFSQECWLEVTDANGDVLASDLEMAGATRELQGRAPFQVKLGNSRGVSLSLNGYDVPIEPREGTNVRTLRIGR